MEKEQFPFSQYLQEGDVLAICNTPEDEIGFLEARDLLRWYPKDCNCDACIMSMVLLEFFKRKMIVRTKIPLSEYTIIHVEGDINLEAHETAKLLVMLDLIQAL